MTSITRKNAKKVLEVVDAGLVSGLGSPKPGYMCVEAAVCYALGLPHGDNPDCVAPSLRSLKIRLNDSSWSSPAARAKGLRRLAIAQLGSAGALDEKEFRKRIVYYALRISTPKALRSAASICRNADHKQKLLDAANKCEVEGSRKAAQEARVAAANAADNAAANAAYAADNAAANAAYAAAYAAANAAYAAYAAAYAAANADNAADNVAYAAANAAYAADNAARDKALSEYAETVVGILIEMKAPGTKWLDLAPLEAA